MRNLFLTYFTELKNKKETRIQFDFKLKYHNSQEILKMPHYAFTLNMKKCNCAKKNITGTESC